MARYLDIAQLHFEDSVCETLIISKSIMFNECYVI